MSIEPSHSWEKPSPVPGPSTEYCTPGLAALKSAPTIELIGSTVEEPDMTISPVSAPPLPPGDADEPELHAVSSSRPPKARVMGVRTHGRLRSKGVPPKLSGAWFSRIAPAACGAALNQALADRQRRV